MVLFLLLTIHIVSHLFNEITMILAFHKFLDKNRCQELGFCISIGYLFKSMNGFQ